MLHFISSNHSMSAHTITCRSFNCSLDNLLVFVLLLKYYNIIIYHFNLLQTYVNQGSHSFAASTVQH